MSPIDGAPAPTISSGRFGMAHALVITAFLAAAVILTLAAHMAARDTLTLLGGAGAVAVVVLVSANVKGGNGKDGGTGLLRRLLSAAFSPGSGTGV
ncbi:hypothetical protein [Streptomyces sp. NBC_01296]|uniref:hypothetical protein n=1 Tax=Streptomyces sp. NBC_01296 TaxID=2903816 RepID=UPI002E135914|nr:hypothetical protein OG299_00015 [Streptomyces sp. NBC_01296]WSN53472.1 hypothetical protein OG299_40500 [Streptomyces sp. NBC_01296]WSN54309.1 hypothetical protein OG299_42525 [Streptomyces sp. NBC_01296]